MISVLVKMMQIAQIDYCYYLQENKQLNQKVNCHCHAPHGTSSISTVTMTFVSVVLDINNDLYIVPEENYINEMEDDAFEIGQENLEDDFIPY
jgi:hypothetical protein